MLITIISISLLFLSCPISAETGIETNTESLPVNFLRRFNEAKEDSNLSAEDKRILHEFDTSLIDRNAVAKFKEEDFYKKCRLKLEEIRNEILAKLDQKAKETPEAIAMANSFVPGFKLVTDLLKGDHTWVRLAIQIGQISKLKEEYLALIAKYDGLQNTPKHEIDNWKQALQHRVTQTNGMKHVTAIMQLGLPIGAHVFAPTLQDWIQDYVTSAVAGGSYVTTAVSAIMSDEYRIKSVQKELKYVMDSTFEYCKIQWNSQEMKQTRQDMKDRFTKQVNDFSQNSYVQQASQWAADKGNDLLGWFGYGSKSIPNPQPPQITAVSEDDSTEGRDLADMMSNHRARMTKGFARVDSVPNPNELQRFDTPLTPIAASGLSAPAARRLLDEESGVSTYTILMNLTIVIVFLLSVSII